MSEAGQGVLSHFPDSKPDDCLVLSRNLKVGHDGRRAHVFAAVTVPLGNWPVPSVDCVIAPFAWPSGVY